MDGGQLAAVPERLERSEEVTLLFVCRRAGLAVLSLVAGEAPIRLDVEEEVIRRPLDPPGHDWRLGNAIEGGVDLDDGKVPSVEAQLVPLLAPTLQLLGIEAFVIGPVAGSNQDRRSHGNRLKVN